MPRLAVSTCLLAVAVSIACDPVTRQSRPAQPALRAAFGDRYLDVHNDHWLPIRIYAVGPAGRYFLGEIEPERSARYRVPAELLDGNAAARLVAQPRGAADEYTTAPVEFGAEARVEWRLKKSLYTSRPR